MLLQVCVDQARNGLERRGPFAVATAEDDVVDAAERVGGQVCVLYPRTELSDVVGRRSIIRGRYDDQSALFRQAIDIVIERRDGGGEAPGLAILADAMRDVLGRSQVRAEKHQQRRGMLRCTYWPDSLLSSPYSSRSAFCNH